jgi:thioredoxin-related protein
MTRTTILTGALLLAAVLIGFILQSEGNPGAEAATELVWKSFDEGVLLAKQQNKKIIVDVYTDWCSWCKKMDKEVYASPSVMSVLSSSYIAVKLNAESSSRSLTFKGKTLTEEQFAASAGVTGYPTTLFLDASANPITVLPGFVPAERFVPILKYIGDNHYQSISFEEYQKRSSR